VYEPGFRCSYKKNCSIGATWIQPPYESESNSSGVIVLSYGHNGFGNQLFQHSFGYTVARILNAHFYVDAIDLKYAFDHHLPPNTGTGAAFVDSITPDAFKFYTLPQDSLHKKVCDGVDYFIGDRPRDMRAWDVNIDARVKTDQSNGTLAQWKYQNGLKASMRDLRCLKLVGRCLHYSTHEPLPAVVL
jgi:hypothetical protein